jgi:putative phosphoesterase
VKRYDADVIVYGHTHKPLIETVGAVLVVNPGAAGPRRFNLKPSIGLLRIENGRANAEIVPL